MRLRNYLLLLTITICVSYLPTKSQSRSEENWRDIKPKTVTLYSRAKYKDEFKGYDKSAFSFRHNVRSDIGQEVTRNNYELQYGNLNINGNSDWFGVTLVMDDCSRIKDLGELSWIDILDVPFLPASIEPQKGINLSFKTKNFENSSDGQVTKVVAGHIYVVHSKDSDSDLYTLFRVDKLVPSDKVTISWKLVPSPEK